MSMRVLSRWDEQDVDGRHCRDTEPVDPIDESRRTASWSFPEDPHERRRIRNRLIVLAAAVPIVQLLRWLFR